MADVTEVMGTDILHKKDFQKVTGESGDIQVITGLENFKEALIHRIITSPGALAHRPTYGVGLKSFQNAQPNIETKRRLAQAIQTQLLKDPRCAEVLSVQIDADDASPYLQFVKVSVKAAGYDEEIKLELDFGSI